MADLPDRDGADALMDAVRRAIGARHGLRIAGTGSKGFLTRGGCSDRQRASHLLSTTEHRGIIEYRPEELVVTARAGTPLALLERELAKAGQRLPFEPPQFVGGGTLGGAVAAGLAGPGRTAWGSVRDAVLGVEMINGLGERLAFGGQVVKNVAGYDLSRLQVGAFGTLGLLLSISVKVLPVPAVERTLVFELPAHDALTRLRGWARHAYPITASCVMDGRLRVRVSGAAPAVEWASRELGGETADDTRFWRALRDHELAHFRGPGTLWRCSVPPASSTPLEDCVIGWGGAERWWRPVDPASPAAAQIRSRVLAEGGTVRLFDGTFGHRGGALDPARLRYAARLKQAFDPEWIFNPELSPAEPS